MTIFYETIKYFDYDSKDSQLTSVSKKPGQISVVIHAQYGRSQSKKKLGLGDKYHRSIKVHTYEAQNQHHLKSPLSDFTAAVVFVTNS